MSKVNSVKISLPQRGEVITGSKDLDLRTLLLRSAPGFLYAKPMDRIHCRGLGTCGTCAIQVKGDCTPTTRIEKWRLNFPPHREGLNHGLRLACQCRPQGDLEILKLSGLWGQGPGKL